MKKGPRGGAFYFTGPAIIQVLFILFHLLFCWKKKVQPNPGTFYVTKYKELLLLHNSILSRMLIPQKNRRLIYEHLFKEGVMVAKKDFNLPKHREVDVPNLQVIKSLQVRG